jgi:hypothetical protein
MTISVQEQMSMRTATYLKIISQKIDFFITTAVRTSNLTQQTSLQFIKLLYSMSLSEMDFVMCH